MVPQVREDDSPPGQVVDLLAQLGEVLLPAQQAVLDQEGRQLLLLLGAFIADLVHEGHDLIGFYSLMFLT